MERWHDFLDRCLDRHPESSALSDSSGVAWSYAELDRATDDLKGELERAGTRPGDRVMILSENCGAVIAAAMACSRLGAWALPFNARQTSHEVARILEHAQPRVILFTSHVSQEAAAHADAASAKTIEGAFGTLQMATPFPSAPERDRDVAALMYTTGTTGAPKGVMICHSNFLYAAEAMREYRPMEPDHKVYGVTPTSHIIGLAAVATGALCAGATVHYEPRFSVEGLYEHLTNGVTHLVTVPQMHTRLMGYVQERGQERLENASLVYVASGGAPMDPVWKRKAETFYGLPMQNGWGMTETTAGAVITHNGFHDPDTSVGHALTGTHLKIDTHVPGGSDTTGEILIKGPNVMKGYYKNPEATDAVLDAEGWLRTGDLGSIDAQNRLHILGRTKEVIIHGGFNVYPPEVEAVLNDHPDVSQCAVVGQNVGGDEKIIAFVEAYPKTNPDSATLKAFAAERLTGYKRPTQIVVVDRLPAAPSGKILKHALLEVFSAHLTN